MLKYFNSNTVRLRVHLKKQINQSMYNFNSNTVRLRVSSILKNWGCGRNFNSNTVRLRARILRYKFPQLFKFQFQYGAIKRISNDYQKLHPEYFNSNTVRLRVIICSGDRDALNNFNSNTVRLRVNLPCILLHYIFISIPIRCD